MHWVLADAVPEVWVINARHMRNVPGRKIDVADAQWGAQRLHKVLEDAGVKLSSVASHVLTKSGRAMLDALIAGQRDPEALQDPHRVAVALLVTIPGVSERTAQVILAEIGTDMSRFPTAGHLASWAGMCPANNESAGKHGSGATRHGSKWLRIALVEADQAAGRTKNTDLSAHYARIRTRRGPRRAAVAVGHTILVISWHLLATGKTYTDLGADYFDKRHATANRQHRLVAQLEAMGHKVTLEPAA